MHKKINENVIRLILENAFLRTRVHHQTIFIRILEMDSTSILNVCSFARVLIKMEFRANKVLLRAHSNILSANISVLP